MLTLGITTWNIGAGPGKSADLDALAEASQVICCQEGGDRQPLLTGWAKRTGWALFAGTTGGGPKVPILTAPGLRVVDARTVIAVGRFRVGDPGAGPAWLQRKAANVVTLAVDGGDELHVLNTHMVASVTRSKLPNAWLRRRHYRRHMAALCRLIDSLDGPLVVCGDFNAEEGFDLLAPLLDRVDLVPSGPTHGGRRIDLIGTRDLEHDADAVTRETSSDHRAVTATLTLPEVPSMPKPTVTPPPPGTKPYDLTVYDDRKVDWLTRQALEAAAAELGYADGRLTLTQGSYSTAVGASAGTHAGGGAVDGVPYDWERKVRVLRKYGFAAWYRPELWRNGVRIWGPHIHAIQVGNKKLSDEAKAQVAEYLAGYDGLAGNGRDTGPRDYVGVQWEWVPPAKPAKPTRGRKVEQADQKLDEALALLADAQSKKGSPRFVALDEATTATAEAIAALGRVPTFKPKAPK